MYKFNFEIWKDQLEFHILEINLMEHFGERSPKGDKNNIPFCLMKIYGETLVIEALESTLILNSMEFFT